MPLESAPRVASLRVRNYRALRDFELRDLTAITAFVGPNGSGKSTIFDVFAFLHEAFTGSLRAAVEKRYGVRELRSRGEEGPISIEITYTVPDMPGIRFYGFAFGEREDEIVVLGENLGYYPVEEAGAEGTIYVLDEGFGISGDHTLDWDAKPSHMHGALVAPPLGLLDGHPVASSLMGFVSDWYLSDLDATDVRSLPGAGPQRRVSRTGDNVANVLEWLRERHPERLERVEAELRKRVPRLARIAPVATGDGRFMLQLEDAPFARGIPAKFASEGTLSLLAYLTVLYGPDTPALMGFEEPEENLPPQLLHGLTEAFREAAEGSQVMLNTHSPYVLNALHLDEVWVLARDEAGFTRAVRAADVPGVSEMVNAGAALGDLWVEGFFGGGEGRRGGGVPERREPR